MIKESGKIKLEDGKTKRKPIPGLVYTHYKGGLYEVLFWQNIPITMKI